MSFESHIFPQQLILRDILIDMLIDIVGVAVCVSVKLQGNNSSGLQIQIDSSPHTVCADTWNSQLSLSTCQYLGYR